jgi:hypothetical protein
MALRLLAVGMLDVDSVGKDTFFVEVGDEIHLYVAHRSGRVFRVAGKPITLQDVKDSVERFNASFWVERPLALEQVSELAAYLGRFEPVPGPGQRCRLRGSPDADAEVSVSGAR